MATMTTWRSDDPAGPGLEAARVVLGDGRVPRGGPDGAHHRRWRVHRVLPAGRRRDRRAWNGSSWTRRPRAASGTSRSPATTRASGSLDDGSGAVRIDAGEALDVDLAFSPVFNALPIRRLGLHREKAEQTLPMVFVALPEVTIEVAEQTYRTVRTGTDGEPAVVGFSADDFAAEMTVGRRRDGRSTTRASRCGCDRSASSRAPRRPRAAPARAARPAPRPGRRPARPGARAGRGSPTSADGPGGRPARSRTAPPVDASAPRIAPSRPSASSTAASSADRLPSHIASTSSGRVPATRVPSANDPAASDSARSSPCSPAPTAASTAANRCGRCEIRATAMSCSSAAAGTTRDAARPRPAPRRRARRRGPVRRRRPPPTRRRRTGRGSPAAHPDSAVPAIGCPPT